MLNNLKVIELASVLAGPSVGMFLAELGAEVIKIENPHTLGDVTRSWRLKEENNKDDISAYFSCANWGKQSLAVDIASEEGQAIVHELVKKADIVVSSYKAGDAERYGMDHATLSGLNSKLIYAAISGYGEDDPRVAYDAVLQAETGFMSMNGTPESGPLKMPVALIDVLAAHQLKEAVLLALIGRMQDGKGRKLSVNLRDSALASLANQATNYLQAGVVAELQGSEHPNIAPYGDTFQTKDGKMLILAVGSDKQFTQLCGILGMPELSSAPDFSHNKQRVLNRDALKKHLAEAIARQDSEQLTNTLKQSGVPCGIVRNIAEALEDGRSIKISEDKYTALSQISFQGGDRKKISRPPHFGEHSTAVLKAELGLDDTRISELLNKGVILQA